MKPFDDPIASGRPPRPNRRLVGGPPRDLTEIHQLVHKLTCTLEECIARPREWCRDPREGHHLERYYAARDAGLITAEEMALVIELPHRPRENSFAIIALAPEDVCPVRHVDRSRSTGHT